MNSLVEKYNKFLIEKKATKADLSLRKQGYQTRIDLLAQTSKNLIEARDILSAVGILSYQEIKDVIEELVTQSLQSVFGDNYSFELENKISRNKPETYLYVTIDGSRRSLKDEQGGGVADIVAFSLRVVLWALSSKRTDNVMILDEPLRFVDKKHLEICGDMLRTLSEMLELQFILVTHEGQLIDAADTAFHVSQVDGVSTVDCEILERS